MFAWLKDVTKINLDQFLRKFPLPKKSCIRPCFKHQKCCKYFIWCVTWFSRNLEFTITMQFLCWIAKRSSSLWNFISQYYFLVQFIECFSQSYSEMKKNTWGITTLNLSLKTSLTLCCRRADSAKPPTRKRLLIPSHDGSLKTLSMCSMMEVKVGSNKRRIASWSSLGNNYFKIGLR